MQAPTNARPRPRSLTIRDRVRGLLILATGLLIVGGTLAHLAIQESQSDLDRLKSQTVMHLRESSRLDEIYRQLVVDSVQRVRDGVLDWDSALALLDRAAVERDAVWQQLSSANLDPEEAEVLRAIHAARLRADRAIVRLRGILKLQNREALDAFAQDDVYSAIAPLGDHLQRFAALQVAEADRLTEQMSAEASKRLRWNLLVFTIGVSCLSLLGISLVLWINRGMNRLLQMTQALARNAELADLGGKLGGEFDVLANGFRQLQQKLLEQRQQLRGHQDHLKRELRAATQRLQQSNHALDARVQQLMLLSRSPAFDDGDVRAAASLVLKAARNGLGVERASLWLWEESREALDRYLQIDVDGSHEGDGVRLQRERYPRYFEALDQERAIVAADAAAHHSTHEFAADYLAEHRIGAMLDVPLRRFGTMVGVLCCEHVGSTRQWQDDEVYFASALADFTARALSARERRDALASLASLNATLEQRVGERTASAQLAAQEASLARGRLESIASSIPGLVYQVEYVDGQQPQVTFVSGRLLELILPEGFSAAERDAKAWCDAICIERDREWLMVGMTENLAKVEPWSVDFRVNTRSGEVRWLHSEAVPRRLADGRVIAPGYWSDINDRKQMERVLARARDDADVANRAKSAFVAAMSHEIRTPIIGVTGMLEVLATTKLDADQRHMVDVMQRSAHSLTDIIGDILDFSKIEAGKLELVPSPVSIARLVTTTVDNFAPPASEKGLLLEACIDPLLAPAHAVDAVRLRQILTNFLSNAIKFTERGGVRVDVEVLSSEPAAQRLRLSVRDSGIGLTREQQERLFRPFVQADASTTRRFGGTGLGLSICRRLSTLMGGNISLTSAAGEGTTIAFEVDLPVVSAGAGDADIDMPVEAASRGRMLQAQSRSDALDAGNMLLLVEDHAINQMVLRRQLELIGFHVDVADDGASGLALWQTQPYALVITDLHMPRLDGAAMVERMRELERTRSLSRTPIIALTAAALPEERTRCVDAGVDTVLLKPCTVHTLSDTLHKLLPHLPWAARLDLPVQVESSENSILDQGVLAAACGGDADAMRMTIEEFRTALDGDVTSLDAALDCSDTTAIMRQAHRIKGASRMVGAGELASAAAALESEIACEPIDWHLVGQVRERLERARRRFVTRPAA